MARQENGSTSTPEAHAGNGKSRSHGNAGKILATAAGVAAATVAGVVAVRKLRGDGGAKHLTVYHVLPLDDGWSIKMEGAEEASSHHDTKKAALDAARELVKSREPSQLVIHRQDGTIQDAHTYRVH